VYELGNLIIKILVTNHSQHLNMN